MSDTLVLVAESNPLIGVDVCDALERAGYRVLGPAVSVIDALTFLRQETPTLAVLDVELRDGPSVEVVRELRRRNVAFLIYSKYQPDAGTDSVFEGAPWITKTAPVEEVVAELAELSLLAVAQHQNLMPSTPLNPFILKLERFALLSEADRALLAEISSQPIVIPPRTNLVSEGDKPAGVFLMLSGFAIRSKLRASGSRQINAHLIPGDLSNLDVALLDEMDHSITTVSISRVVCLSLEVITKLLTQHSQIGRALRMSTLVDEATLREWLLNVGRRLAVERLAHLFCELLLRLRVVGLAPNNIFEFPLTQEDLADTTGMSVVHLNRSLKELRQCGLVDFKDGRLRIHDFVRLQELAEFRPNYLHLRARDAA